MGESPETDESAAADQPREPPGSDAAGDSTDVEALRRRVEEEYDFEDFGPRDMADMAPEEWEAAFDPDTWITGEELLDRVEADLRTRVADREVFARVERFDDVLVAYDDAGYAAVYPDGSVDGRGTVLRDVKPTVALCSMDTYDVPDPPEDDAGLPSPEEVPEGGATLGNTVLQVVGGVQILAGLVLLGAGLLSLTGLYRAPGIAAGGTNLVVVGIAGIGFLLVGVFLFVTVANARLSDRFRAEEYRDRLRAIGLEDGERPAFLAEIDGVDLETGAGSQALGQGRGNAAGRNANETAAPVGSADGDTAPSGSAHGDTSAATDEDGSP
ncbi:MAG: hypothetical protein V5A43_05435 [Haloarculaceae archaeon]